MTIKMTIIDNSKISFVFALMKCNYVAFGEQNKMKGCIERRMRRIIQLKIEGQYLKTIHDN